MGAKIEHAKALYMEGIRDGNPREAVMAHTGAVYRQHSTGVKDGQAGFIEFFEDFIARNPKREIEIVRGWEDGRYVFLQAYQSLNDGEFRYVTTDFFDTDVDDKVIEHWDVISEFKGANPSGHTQVDGATEIVDLDKTEANKAIVRELIEQVLFPGGQVERIGEFIAEDYIQHNVDVPDGLAAFEALAKAPNRPLNYDEIVLCVGSGNFVATLSRANWEGQPLCQADIFRLENGKIVEHWDNSEPVPDTSVNSGKF